MAETKPKVWFTADTHFGHPRILEYCSKTRPFSSTDAMDETIIQGWNEVVAPEDEVWHLGDFGFHTVDPDYYLSRLNGKKHLVTGNHDGTACWQARGWHSVQPYEVALVGGRKVVMFHYGLRVWDRMRKGSVMLYGHSHGTLPGFRTPWNGGTADVGVDCWGLKPTSLKAVYERLKTLPMLEIEGGDED